MIFIFLFIFCPLSLAQQSDPKISDFWQKGQKKFKEAKTQKDYKEAAIFWEAIVEKGVQNAYLFYNLGNAYLKSDKIGYAILYYRKAQIYDDFPELQQNLSYARSLIDVKFKGTEYKQIYYYLFFWHHWFSYHTRFIIFLFFYSLFWVVLFLKLKKISFPFFTLLCMITIILIAFGSSLGYEYLMNKIRPEAVLVGDSIVARKGDGDNYQLLYGDKKIPSGIEVYFLEKRGEWCKVEFPDKTKGWIRDFSVKLIVTK